MKSDGGPAFPTGPQQVLRRQAAGVYRSETVETGGMSLRDFFAGGAMEGAMGRDRSRKPISRPDEIATWAYAVADAMLAEREKP